MKAFLTFSKSLYSSFLQKCFLITLITSFVSAEVNAANYFWVGGSGNWSALSHWATTSGGTTFHSQIPTALDDVFFDANSFTAAGQTVTLDALTTLAHDMTWTGVTNNPTLAGSSGALLKIYGSIRFVSGMNMNFAGDISFEATATGKTIAMGGKAFQKTVSFIGIGGGWALQDAFTVTGSIQLVNGSLTTGNQTVTAAAFSSPGGSPRSLIMGSSVFNLSGAQFWSVSGGLTINAGTSVINATAANIQTDFNGGSGFTYYDLNFPGTGVDSKGYIRGTGNTFHDVNFASPGFIIDFGNGINTFRNVSFSKEGEIQNSNIFNNLSFTAGYTYLLSASKIQTVNGTLSANGNCGAFVDIHSSADGAATTINHPAGAVNVSFVILKDVTAGGGGTFTANNSVNLGNNTGWTINSPAAKNLFWIGNTGNWSDGSHWSLASGGAPSGCSPTPVDNVFFDAGSFSAGAQSVNINVPTVYCRDMTWTGVTNTPAFAGAETNLLKIYGSLTFSNAMTLTFLGKTNFEATTTGKTITMNSMQFNNDAVFNGIGGGWGLQDAFSTLRIIYLNSGTLTTNSKAVFAKEFHSNPASVATRSMIMGSSVFTISGGSGCWQASSAGFTLNSGTSTINCTDGGPEFRGGNLVYYDMNFTNSSSNGEAGDNNTFHDVVYSGAVKVHGSNTYRNATFLGFGQIESGNIYTNLTITAPYSYLLGAGTVQSVSGTLTATGTCNSFIIINSTISGQTASISHPAGAVPTAFLILRDITATGGGTFNTTQSVNLGNNTGWNFVSPAGRNLYWIGNTGNWNDGSHWALTSGGAPSGCSPSPLDNVFFDVNSFSSPGRTVTITAPTAYCRDMTWTGVTNTPTFAGASGPTLSIYGSLIFASAMNQNFLGDIYFEATSTGKTITTAGQSFKKNILFRGSGGGWTLQDNIAVAGTINLSSGTFPTNNKSVNASLFFSAPTPGLTATPRTVNMGSSIFNLSSANVFWSVTAAATGTVINCGTSVINSTTNGTGAQFNGGGGLVYYDVNFTGTGSSSRGTIQDDNNTFHDVFFGSSGFINSPSIFHDVTISGDGELSNNNTFNNLTFTAGFTYKAVAGGIQTIGNNWKIQGSCTLYIILQSSVAGGFATFTKPSGTVPGYNIHLRDIKCTGGATFIAYNSVDLGGNSGWAFSSLPPLLNPNLISGPASVCPGATNVAYHIDPVQGAIGYQWIVPAGATIVSGQGTTDILVNFGSAISGTVSVQSFNGCNFGTLSSSITLVAGSPTAPVLSISVLPAGSICPGTSVTFTALSVPNSGAGATYNFKVNGNSIQNSSLNTYITSGILNGDIVDCILTTGTGACAGSFVVPSNNTITMSVYPKPVITFNPASPSITSGSSVQLNAMVTGNITTYLWTPAAGLSSTSIYNPVANPVKTTEYHLKVTTADNCTADSSLIVTVLQNCSIVIPNAFTPNGDGINDKWVIARGTCVVEFRVSVYNRYGNLVYHSDNYQSDWDGTYKSKPMPDGTYYYVAKAVRNGIDYEVRKGDVTILR